MDERTKILLVQTAMKVPAFPLFSQQSFSPQTSITSQNVAISAAELISDVGHMATETRQHLEWSERLHTEFFAQGDKEKELNLPVSPLMNRDKPGVMDPSNQKTFASVIVIPMIEAWMQIAPGSGRKLMAMAVRNRQYWEGQQMPSREEV
eukprot:scaffold340472_cov45-Prasinocladus_malaysianus.AAC.2